MTPLLPAALGAACGWMVSDCAADLLLDRAFRREAAWLACGSEAIGRIAAPLAGRWVAPSKPLAGQRAFCAAFSGLAWCVAAGQPGLMAQVAFVACALSMAAALACDLRARIIPVEACVALALAGAAFQAMAGGWQGAVAGCGYALALTASAWAANRMLRARCPEGALGGGDIRCMAALCLACGAASPIGFAACFMAAGAAAALGCATGRLALGDGIPLAPFLGVWLLCGAVAC